MICKILNCWKTSREGAKIAKLSLSIRCVSYW